MSGITLQTLDTKINNIGREIGDIKKALNGNGQPGLIKEQATLSTVLDNVTKEQEKMNIRCARLHQTTPENKTMILGNLIAVFSIVTSLILGAIAIWVSK